MVIGYDAKRAAQNRTGLGNYSRHVCHTNRIYGGEDRHILFIPNEKKVQQLKDLPEEEKYEKVFPKGWLWKRMRAMWRTFGVAREAEKRGVELYHGLSNELPVGLKKRGIRSVVTIHDVIFIEQPEYYKPIDRWIYRAKFAYAGRKAERVVTVSEYSKRQIEKHLHVPVEKIDVVYPGIYMDFSGVSEEEKERVRREYGLKERYVLYVGTVEERKNLMLVAKAMSLMKEQGVLPEDMRVAVVGRHTAYTDRLRKYLEEKGLGERFLFRHNVGFKDLPAVYKAADMVVYPSRIEGFGSPMQEAAAAGVPAIGCKGSCLEEAGGEGAFYVDPDDATEMMQCMLRLWNDARLRAERGAAGLRHADRFAPERLFEDMQRVYRKAMQGMGEKEK